MEPKTVESGTTLRIARTYAASPEEIFEALTDPKTLTRWFAPSEEFDVYVDRFDARVGGRYRIEMRHQDGDVHTAVGTIREIDRPSRLVYTWTWEGGEMGDTLVTWALSGVDEGTELTLTHEQFPDEESRSQHMQGWTAMAVRLETVLG